MSVGSIGCMFQLAHERCREGSSWGQLKDLSTTPYNSGERGEELVELRGLRTNGLSYVVKKRGFSYLVECYMQIEYTI